MLSNSPNEFMSPIMCSASVEDYHSFIEKYRSHINVSLGGTRKVKGFYDKSCKLVMQCSPNDPPSCLPFRIPLSTFKINTPILSYGCILRYNSGSTTEYLVLKRNLTYEFLDLLYGNFREAYLYVLCGGLTEFEKSEILTKDFDTLWDTYANKVLYSNLKDYSKGRYERIINALKDMLPDISLFDPTGKNLYLFPKGKLNYISRNGAQIPDESPIACAMREFTEETYGIPIYRDHIVIEHPLIESYIGSNTKNYCTKYFVFSTDTRHDTTGKQVQWMTYEDIQSKCIDRRIKIIDLIESKIKTGDYTMGHLDPIWETI